MCVAPRKKNRHRAVSQQNRQTNGIGFITAVTTSSANPTHYLQQLLEATTGTTVTNSGSASLGLVPTANSPQMNIIILIQACIGRTPIFNSMLYKSRKINT